MSKVRADYAPRMPRKQPLTIRIDLDKIERIGKFIGWSIVTIVCAAVIGYAGAHYFYPQYF